MFEINYSRLIQYEILEKLVTYIDGSRAVCRIGFNVRKKCNVYSPRHFWSCYKVIFGHLYSVMLTILLSGLSGRKLQNNFDEIEAG